MVAAVSMAQTPTVSASSVTFKYCQTTYETHVRQVGQDCFDNFSWLGVAFTTYGTQVTTIENARGCDSIVTLTVEPMEGALPYAFSVSATKKVYFSKGNLQYCAAPTSGPTTHETRDGNNTKGIWRFAEKQWDCVRAGGSNATVYYNNGGSQTKCSNASRGESYAGWIDLFKFGTSGYKGFMPYTNTYFNKNSYTETEIQSGGTISRTSADWGWYNAISNGGNSPETWFMLTWQEWMYLYNSRTAANQKRATGTVAGVYGIILLPDVWTKPSTLTFNANASNTYTADQWSLMEAAGAVFLPCAGGGQRAYSTAWYSYYNESSPMYWTSSMNGTNVYFFSSTDLTNINLNGAEYLYCVRLVRLAD